MKVLQGASRVAAGMILLGAAARCGAADPPRHNVIIFVADGLRHGAVDTGVMPTFAEVRKNGVDFVNSHALFPTVTTPNASAIATGHYLGDTGDFANGLFMGFPQRNDEPALAVEDNINIAVLNDHCGGNFLSEESFIAAARHAGMHTAILGKHGPALVQSVTLNNADMTPQTIPTIFFDDATGTPVSRSGNRIGVPLPADFSRRLANDPFFKRTYFDDSVPSGDPRTPGRVANNTAGTKVANSEQQQYLIDVLTRAILPEFVDPAGDKKPFAVVYWSRDPDGTQHNEQDGPGLVPGINGPTVKLAFENVDHNLKQLLAYLRAAPDPVDPAKKLADTTDIFITSDHGFGTISRGPMDNEGHRIDSFAIQQRYSDVRQGLTVPGMISIDLAHDLELPLYDGDTGKVDASVPGVLQYRKLKVGGTAGAGNWAEHPNGPGLIGGAGTYRREAGFSASLIVVGGAIYAPQATQAPADEPARELIRKTVASLAKKQYVSGIFVDTRRFGTVPGALSLADINLLGGAQTPVPAIIINTRSFSTDPADPYMTGIEIPDTGTRQGQGTHGSFGRHCTYNCMIALGPDFKAGFSDTDPVSNADIAITLSKVLGIDLLGQAHGTLHGRVMSEALAGGPALRGGKALQKSSQPAAEGVRTYLQYQEYADETGTYLYFDAAGFPGATVGLTAR